MEAVKDYGRFCVICQNNYNLTTIPYVLKCGHTFCYACANKNSCSSNTSNRYECHLCRQISNDPPSKNFALIEVLNNDDSYEVTKSKSIGYCADHDMVLILDSLYEHRIHDWFLLSNS
ncbi:unnamed protein product [Blepharisma stoltei]|uniref:RING-type domain-containing protein n=1 Tax=Blepharisma stoltei TaxID=1481888 RepID=A0AAU9J6W7_9CILI|nr:unnamed protein product [Blepharisma stoltei]